MAQILPPGTQVRPKKLLFALLFLPFLGYSQDVPQQQNQVYAEIVGIERSFSPKLNIHIDFGEETSFSTAENDKIMDAETGKPKKFNSMVNAMNFMGTMGWEFTQAYIVTISGTNIYHWIIKRKLTETESQNFLPTARKDLIKPATY